jgi:hypothetical protein
MMLRNPEAIDLGSYYRTVEFLGTRCVEHPGQWPWSGWSNYEFEDGIAEDRFV